MKSNLVKSYLYKIQRYVGGRGAFDIMLNSKTEAPDNFKFDLSVDNNETTNIEYLEFLSDNFKGVKVVF